MRRLHLVVVFFCLFGGLGIAHAQYVLVLKNGRQITVQSYREEGSMIKFMGLGGEIGLPKDQVKAILKPGQSDRTGLNISDLDTPPPPQATTTPQKAPSSTARETPPPPDSAETKPLPDANEAKEYQKRLAEVTLKLETANREYFEATQGGGTGSNVSKEGFRSWAADFGSRIRDSQKVPGGGGASDTPPMPPYGPVYTPKEKQLSDMRSQVDRLQKERDGLIQEMKSKNIPTG